MGTKVDGSMRALKVLVVVMGVLLVAGVIALAMVVVARVERGATAASLAPAKAGPLREALPAGSHILATDLSGDRLFVRVALAEGGEQLLLFDAKSGAPVAVIELAPPR
jgi:hypothetical protein